MACTEVFEPGAPAHEQVLQVCECRHVPGHDLVAHQLLEFRHRNLERCVGARRSPRTRASRRPSGRAQGSSWSPRTTHSRSAGTARWRAAPCQLGGEIRDKVLCAERVVVSDVLGAERSDRFLRHTALEAPGVYRLEQRLCAGRRIPGSRKQLSDSAPFASGRDGSGGAPVIVRTQRSYGTGGPLPTISMARASITSQQRPSPPGVHRADRQSPARWRAGAVSRP